MEREARERWSILLPSCLGSRSRRLVGGGPVRPGGTALAPRGAGGRGILAGGAYKAGLANWPLLVLGRTLNFSEISGSQNKGGCETLIRRLLGSISRPILLVNIYKTCNGKFNLPLLCPHYHLSVTTYLLNLGGLLHRRYIP